MHRTNRLPQMNPTGSGYMRANFNDPLAQSEDSTLRYQHGSKPNWQIAFKNRPKRPEGLWHIDAQPSQSKSYIRIPELSHRRRANWREVSLCTWSLNWFSRSLLFDEGSLHNKVAFYSCHVLVHTLIWWDALWLFIAEFILLFLMSFFCDLGSCCAVLLSRTKGLNPSPWQGSRILFSWRGNEYF